ncbi:type I-U CRISPR-associated RAMP protein Csb1/Cas7u [Vibrio sp. PID23_8]|uniref:type I-G CRISPR-associated RAMP protein Csb1/Cas7g n=1 Tax=Vibrio sp. PID23_8 TaxID=1583767 RepID=UPI000E67702F|nr:type I-U CRISPR-associated RAMP protein Csb1/Cas7u [Vibrio sp. PID23_8]RIZ56023.1 hypothetical protein AK966_05500 [Vibrio sp. PID23_8]
MKNLIGIRVEATLKPVNGSSHIYPSTYANSNSGGPSNHNFTGYNKSTGEFLLVEVDSVGSFANRIEAELYNLEMLPNITTDVNGTELSAMELPHRIYDAILRDSNLEGTPWRESEIGQELLSSDKKDATALYKYAPSTILLGGWDSHGGDAVQGVKLARAVACEIWAGPGTAGNHKAQRIDPLLIPRNAEKYYLIDGALSLAENQDDKHAKKPSELGHGDIPASSSKGVFVEQINFNGHISVTRLNRYQFPDENGDITPERNQAAVNVLVEVAKLGISRVLDSLDLRSGCDLYTESRQCELIYADGTKEAIELSSSTDALESAIEIAKEKGLVFSEKPVKLTANEKLENLANRGAKL